MLGYYILLGAIALVSWLVSNQLKQKFHKYSQVHLRNGMSGREIAEKMLADNGIRDVQVISTPGQLTDHYNPKNKTVNLSESVYSQRNAAAAAVAAHECGHAVQVNDDDHSLRSKHVENMSNDLGVRYASVGSKVDDDRASDRTVGERCGDDILSVLPLAVGHGVQVDPGKDSIETAGARNQERVAKSGDVIPGGDGVVYVDDRRHCRVRGRGSSGLVAVPWALIIL